ncbi:hypothetical protein H5410_014747 [Solanum commersonii]|uniref:Uncharacterized protein n=1 Tax=Solanum commersonii TaxID=4109 RepID=A0A9J5ZS44_SOLCO|nr:hypothetical protein H5410_014747 [Solanum commersonii]
MSTAHSVDFVCGLSRCRCRWETSHMPTTTTRDDASRALANVACRWPTSFTRCAHATTDLCRPWLLLLAIGRRRLPDAHMPRPMRGPLGDLDSVARILT